MGRRPPDLLKQALLRESAVASAMAPELAASSVGRRPPLAQPSGAGRDRRHRQNTKSTYVHKVKLSKSERNRKRAKA